MKELTIKKELRALKKVMESKIDMEIKKVDLLRPTSNIWTLTAYDESDEYMLCVSFDFEIMEVTIRTRVDEVKYYDMRYLSHACKWVITTLNDMFCEYDFYFAIPKNDVPTEKPKETNNRLEYEIKCTHYIDEYNRFTPYGIEMELKEPNMVKVINLDVWLTYKNGKYYITGFYKDKTKFETWENDVRKALKTTADYAIRARK